VVPLLLVLLRKRANSGATLRAVLQTCIAMQLLDVTFPTAVSPTHRPLSAPQKHYFHSASGAHFC
jgi:hypothetical protein